MLSLTTESARALRAVKVVHTVAWAFFAGCVVAIPFVAWARRFSAVLLLATFVVIEIAILAANRWRCPLTAVAARYTTDRSDSFDIYLPPWLARYNKQVFGSLFFGGLLFALARWRGWIG